MAPHRKPKHSAPALVLAAHGIYLDEIARGIGRARSSVSMMLSGQVGLHPSLVDVVRALGGPEVADELVEAIEAQRAVVAS